jgi:hypothetical protein
MNDIINWLKEYLVFDMLFVLFISFVISYIIYSIKTKYTSKILIDLGHDKWIIK